jgi:Spy/CpxP family protein refolding chaperone
MKKLLYLFLSLFLAVTLAAAQNQNETSTPPPQGPQGGPPPHRHMDGGGFPGMPGMLGFGKDWWRDSQIAQQINLTEPQKQQLSTIFASHRSTLITLRGAIENDEGKLRDILEQDQPQQAQVLTQLGQLQSDRNALEQEFTVMTLAFRGVLSPDQWKQLRSLSQQRMMNFRGHHQGRGPGENGPPPPPQE